MHQGRTPKVGSGDSHLPTKMAPRLPLKSFSIKVVRILAAKAVFLSYLLGRQGGISQKKHRALPLLLGILLPCQSLIDSIPAAMRLLRFSNVSARPFPSHPGVSIFGPQVINSRRILAPMGQIT